MPPIALSAAMELLALSFFLVAGIWLIASYFDRIVIFAFSRLQARGHLNNPNDDNFGRCFLCRSSFYIPFGWMFRELARRERQNNDTQMNEQGMTVVERRAAVEKLLLKMLNESDQQEHTAIVNISMENVCDENNREMVPCCCICLGEYHEHDRIFHGSKCSHEFHATCILDWLQQLGKVHCPCCRIPIVDEMDVKKTVRCMRNERQSQPSHCQPRKSSPGANSEASDDNCNNERNTVDVEEAILSSLSST
jgi:hypothetical protein